MRIVRNLFICILVLFSFLALSACEKADDTTSDTALLTNVYVANPVSAPEMLAEVSSYQPFVQGDSLYLYDSFQETYLYCFSVDGTYDKTLSVPSLSEKGLSLRQVLLLQNGDYYMLAADAKQVISLLLVDTNGEILYQTTPEDADNTTWIGAANGDFYCIINNTVIHYDTTLTEQGRFSLDFIPTDFRSLSIENGTDTIYLRDAMGSLYILDGKSGNVMPIYMPDVWDNTTAAYPGYGFAWYYADSEGIFGVNGEEKTLLCSFGNSNLSFCYIQDLVVLSPTAFYIRYQDPVQKNTQNLLLTPSAADVERIPLRMAWLAPTQSEAIRAIVSSFNTSGTEYSIELVDYSRYGLSGADPQGLQQFQKDLLSGESFDLYGMSFASLYGNFAETGALADLSSICDDNLLPSVRAAYETERGIYGLPFGISYSFLAMPDTRTSSLTDIETTSTDSAIDRDTFVCNVDCSLAMIHVFASSLIDGTECRFDSPEFLTFLKTMKQFRENCGRHYGEIATIHYDTYKELRYGGTVMEKAVREDRLRYLYYPMETTTLLGLYKVIYGDVPAHLSGYPTAENDTAADGWVYVNLCAPIDGNITGAKTFLAFYLSDRVQTSVLMKDQIPITETGLAKVTEARYYYYALERFDVVKLRGSYAVQPQNPPTSLAYPIVEVHLTDAEVESFRDLIRTAVLSTGRDDMVTQIISEELEPFFAGDRTAEDTAEIIQKRTAIYLAE